MTAGCTVQASTAGIDSTSFTQRDIEVASSDWQIQTQNPLQPPAGQLCPQLAQQLLLQKFAGDIIGLMPVCALPTLGKVQLDVKETRQKL